MTASEQKPLRVIGRYALYNEIAAGGMATVHIGRLLGPVGFARTVAIKRLHPQFAKDPEFVSMFLDEARLAARVQHPNVVATIDVVATDGELFLIMDYVRGESLSKLLRMAKKRGERIPPRIAASIMCGFLHGLHAAHEAKNERGARINLVHRDVSPQNVLVGADGVPRVLDFGIAKASGRIQVTRDGQIKGKLAYMPPEQLTGRDLTRAVDIYAAAVVMWETLTGRRLFKGETEAETLAKIISEPVTPPSEAMPGVPVVFDGPLLRALSREASKRQATAREFAFELEKCVGVASTSEVGEWVESMVGSILSAREEEIAVMESSSANLRLSPPVQSSYPDSPESESDVLGILNSGGGTLVGVGPPSGGMKTVVQDVPGMVGQPLANLKRYGSEESTFSKFTGSRFVESLKLPVDKRLPRWGIALGIGIFMLGVGVLLSNRGSREQQSLPLAATASSLAPSSELSRPLAHSTTSETGALSAALPPSTGTLDPVAPRASAAGTVAVAAVHVGTPIPLARDGAAVSTKSLGAASPVTRVPASPPSKQSCDPPFTLDASGRKKYKLECM